jgi:DNA-binding XRE family transcriptional regulator
MRLSVGSCRRLLLSDCNSSAFFWLRFLLRKVLLKNTPSCHCQLHGVIELSFLIEKKGSLLNPPDMWNFRTRHDLTGADLARMLGVHKSQICRWETGQREIPLWIEKFLTCLDQTLPGRRSAKASSKPHDSGAGPQ